MCTRSPDNRDFKGVWIPKKLYLDQSITWTAKLLLIEIDSLDSGSGCFASNSYLANFIGVSRDWVKHLLGELKEAGLITVEEREGQRFIRLNQNGETTFNDGMMNREQVWNHDKKLEHNLNDNGEVEVPPGYTIQLTADKEEAIQVIYEFWNSFKDQGNGKWHVHTKVSYAIRLAVVQNLEQWSIEDICNAISNYATVLLDLGENYYWDYTWSLPSFLTSERSGRDKKWWQFLSDNFCEAEYRGTKSEFKSKSNNQDGPIIVPEDINPEITQRLIKMYRNMTNSQRFEPSIKQTVQFIEASAKLVDFYKVYDVQSEDRLRHLRRVLENAYIEKGSTLNVGNLNSKYTWDTLMPQLMRELGYIE